MNLLNYESGLCEKLHTATKLVKDNLKSAQWKMKVWCHKKAQERTFKPGDKVFVMLPIPGHLLRARFCGPYIVERKVNKVHYAANMSEHCKQRRLLCHINMLKKYYVDCSTPSVPHTPLTVAIT